MGRVVGVRPSVDVLVVFLDVGFLLENTAVFQSQVGDQLVALSGMGYATGLVAVAHDPAKFEAVLGLRLRDAGVRLVLVRNGSFFGCLARMIVAVRRAMSAYTVRRAYVRGLWGPIVIALAGYGRRLPYIYDVRGALRDEMAASGASRFKQFSYGAIEAWCIRRAARVTAVSKALADVIGKLHRVQNVSVIPCCVDSESRVVSSDKASQRRAELGLSHKECVLVYSGGLSHYQQVPAMLAIWRGIRDDASIRFLLLTNEDPHRAPMIVGDLRDFDGRLTHLSLPRDAVASTLAAADIGFMLRDSRELNRVASPVKFPEYLNAGLAVVASPGTGDASNLILAHDLGVLVDPADIDVGIAKVREFISRWRKDVAGYKQRGPALVKSHYEWQAQADKFRKLYGDGSDARDERLLAEG